MAELALSLGYRHNRFRKATVKTDLSYFKSWVPIPPKRKSTCILFFSPYVRIYHAALKRRHRGRNFAKWSECRSNRRTLHRETCALSARPRGLLEKGGKLALLYCLLDRLSEFFFQKKKSLGPLPTLIPFIIAFFGRGWEKLISLLYRTKMVPWDQLSTKNRNMVLRRMKCCSER